MKCPKCSRRHVRVADGHYKCRKCRHTWTDKSPKK